jgi:PAS domain-containing protein
MTPSRTYIGKALFAAKAGQDSVQDWRLYVLNTVLGALLIFGTLVAVPSIVTLLYQGLWPAAIADVVILAIGFALWRSPAASFLLRSWGLCTILYLLGFALLFMMGPTSQIYLMMSPAMAAILLGPWPAAWMLVGSSITLFCVGYLGYSNFQIPGLNVDPLAVWFTITLNFVFVNAVITLSISLLIRGLETSFARVAEASRVKSEFINTSLDSIISIDAQGRVTEWSRQAELTFGWSLRKCVANFCTISSSRSGTAKGM